MANPVVRPKISKITPNVWQLAVTELPHRDVYKQICLINGDWNSVLCVLTEFIACKKCTCISTDGSNLFT